MNYYVAGSIQNQKNGIGAIGGADNGHKFNTNVNDTVLTSVGNIGPGGVGGASNDGFYGLDGTNTYSYSSSTAGMLLFSQKGADGNTISPTNGPKGLTVTLTLVPATPSSPTTPANK